MATRKELEKIAARWIQLDEQRKEVESCGRKLAKEAKVLKEEIQEAIGTDEGSTKLGKFLVTQMNKHRDGYTVEPCDYVAFSIIKAE